MEIKIKMIKKYQQQHLRIIRNENEQWHNKNHEKINLNDN
jgi:hypothetical protein